MSPRLSLVLLALLGLALASVVLLDRGSKKSDSALPTASAVEEGRAIEGSEVEPRSPRDGEAVTRKPAEVAQAVAPVWRIETADEAAIAGAGCSFVPFDLVAGELDWWEIDIDAVLERGIWTSSSETGSVEPPQGRGPSEVALSGSVTHPGFDGVGLGRLESMPLDARIVLGEAQATRVRVEDEAGRPVAGADVLALGRVPEARAADAGVAWVVRSARTDESGLATFGRAGPEMLFRAEHGATRSKVWQGPPPAELALELRSLFSARGRVLGNAGAAGSRVSVRVEEMNLEREIAGVRVDGDGGWRLDAIPALPAREYVFRLEAPGFVPQEERRGAPAPGAELVVDFAPDPGIEVVVRVHDAEGAPVGDVGVQLMWDPQGTREWRQLRERTAADGRARIREAPRGSVWIRLRDERWSQVLAYGPFELPRSDGSEIAIQAHPAGVLEGRCTHGGEPVGDFQITLWQGGGGVSVVHDVHDAVDGRFRIGGVTLGDIFVFGTSSEHPQSRLQQLRIEAEVPAWATIELPQAVLARGRVVDVSTFEPIAGASVQVHTTGVDATLRPWGEVHRTGPDGSFEGVPAAPSSNGIALWAPGYQRKMLRVEPRDGAIDAGTVILARPQRLEVRLTGPPEEELSKYTVLGRGDGALPDRGFGRDGVALYEDVDPGWILLQLAHGRHIQQILNVELVPGEDWIVELEAQPERVLQVGVVVTAGEPIPGDLWISASFWLGGASVGTTWAQAGSDGVAEMEWVFGDRTEVKATRASDVASSVLALATVERPEGAVAYVELDLTRPPRELHLLDGSGRALANARCSLTTAEAYRASSSYHGATTDAAGSVPIPASDSDELLLSVKKEGFGLAVDLSVAFDDSGSATARVRPTMPLVVHVRDRDLPLIGVPVDLDGTLSTLAHYSVETDAAGEARFPMIDPASRARVHAERADLWPAETELRAELAQPIVLDVRRRGALALAVRLDPHLRAGCRLSLRSVELGADAASWLADGRITASDPGLTTDAAGDLRIEGLPNGGYEWSLVLPDGSSRSGVQWVAPYERTVLEVAQ